MPSLIEDYWRHTLLIKTKDICFGLIRNPDNEKISVYKNKSTGDCLEMELIFDSPSSEISENSSKFEGTYSFSNATGSQVNGSITLNSNGTWSYSGSKTTLTPGTYSVSNNELTLNWTSKTGNYTLDRTDTFMVSVSGSEATLSSKGSGISAFFSDFFGVTSTMTLTLSYSSN